MTCQEIVTELKANADPKNVAGMNRFGINTEQALGLSMPLLQSMARRIGTDHELALQLWDTRLHEARILASLVDHPGRVTPEQMDHWCADFNSWDLCDQCCGKLFVRTPYAYDKAIIWAQQEEEFVKRAGFALFAWLAVHDKKAADIRFLDLFELIEKGSTDDRNFVKKAVNWALRQIGKRNPTLNEKAIELALRLRQKNTRPARWIGSDAYRELTGDKVQGRFEKRPTRKKGSK